MPAELYSLGANGTLHYRYALEAHGAPIVAFILRPHPLRAAAIPPPPAAFAEPTDSATDGVAAALPTTAAPLAAIDDLLLSVAQVTEGAELQEVWASVFAYDLAAQVCMRPRRPPRARATPLSPPLASR